ncbi:MAG TPA: hypothetical protein VKU85_15880, partial [bacterium]|nr:hypothetical protein [bacterium]
MGGTTRLSMESSPGDITQILLDLATEDRPSRARTDALMKALYAEMHAQAGRLMRRERGNHTL